MDTDDKINFALKVRLKVSCDYILQINLSQVNLLGSKSAINKVSNDLFNVIIDKDNLEIINEAENLRLIMMRNF